MCACDGFVEVFSSPSQLSPSALYQPGCEIIGNPGSPNSQHMKSRVHGTEGNRVGHGAYYPYPPERPVPSAR
nr:hypothetical protein CFP56_13115 [Quercus suber]